MSLKLRVTSGPLKGQEFFLAPGFGIGRSKGDIRLNDQKVSSLHALVIESGGKLVLTDNGSKNGIRVKGAKVAEVLLVEGASFHIGIHSFQVIKGEAAPKPQAPGPSPSRDRIEEEDPLPAQQEWTTTHHPLVETKPKTWEQVLIPYTDRVLGELKDHPKATTPLEPALRLSFVGGMQTETVWILGYGPRTAGSASVDLPIHEPQAPDVCFEIIPSPEGVTFRTNYPKQVTMNGKALRQKALVAGDTIAIGETRIEVELIR